MLSIEQSYSRLFRPWDMSDSKKTTNICSSNYDVANTANTTTIDFDAKEKKRKQIAEKRENRLRKIRGVFRKPVNVHQDDTVSTTTVDDDKKHNIDVVSDEQPLESPVASLSLSCDRLLEDPTKNEVRKVESKTKVEKKTDNIGSFYTPNVVPPPPMYPGYPEYLQTAELASALGVQPTDPLLMESLAQGYAMELEYARILHQENEAKLLNARKQRPKKYKCPHCQVGFSNNGQLKGHIRIHTGERPYKCEEKNCGKTFTRNEELTRHKRIHSGVRPFPCPTCGKKFGRRDHLKKHTRTHYLQAERMMPVFVPLSAVPHGFPYLYGY